VLALVSLRTAVVEAISLSARVTLEGKEVLLFAGGEGTVSSEVNKVHYADV
jgi:hypothetical protein